MTVVKTSPNNAGVVTLKITETCAIKRAAL